MQGQRWNQKEEHHDDAQLNEKQQNQSAELPLIDLEEIRRPGCSGVPEEQRRNKIEQGEDETDDKRGVEKVPEKNDLVAVHVANIHSGRARSITKLRRVGSLNCCRVEANDGQPGIPSTPFICVSAFPAKCSLSVQSQAACLKKDA
jgi:hypothetical protein